MNGVYLQYNQQLSLVLNEELKVHNVEVVMELDTGASLPLCQRRH